ncbi:MAG: DUF4038 domain-containing protein [Gemmataceae bacterium]
MKRIVLSLLTLWLSSPTTALPQPPKMALYDRWEGTFTADKEVDWQTQFVAHLVSPSGKKHNVPGFWDGGKTWRIRFMPRETGKWTYTTTAIPDVPGLRNQKGTFTCVRTKTNNPLIKHGPLRVAKEGHYLQHADGKPFFWMGDTVWNMAIIGQGEEINRYLEDRAKKQFSVIQFVNIAPWRAAPKDRRGRTAFTGRANIKIDPEYFQRIDKRFDRINAKGMIAAPIHVLALKKNDPGNYLPEKDIHRLDRYQIARYVAHHVVWMLAGDNNYRGKNAERWKRIGRAAFGKNKTTLVTTHPTGMNWPWDGWEKEDWLHIIGYQSGHGDSPKTLAWTHSGPAAQNWKRFGKRPVINLEPNYEDILAYQSRKPHTAYNVRRAVYWSLLNAPTAGVTYGAHGLWSWQLQPGTPVGHRTSGTAKVWHEAVQLPGSANMKHVAELFTSLQWWKLRPDQRLLQTQPGRDDPAKYVSVGQSVTGDAVVVYLPVGGRVLLRTKNLDKKLRPQWFDPRKGTYQGVNLDESGVYVAPNNKDWLLVFTVPKKAS